MEKLDYSPYFIIDKWNARNKDQEETMEIKTPFGELKTNTIKFLEKTGISVKVKLRDLKGDVYTIAKIK